MKRKLILWLVLGLFSAVIGCGSDPDLQLGFSTPRESFESLSVAAARDDLDLVMACYTRETQRILVEMRRINLRINPGQGGKEFDLAEIVRNTKWEIAGETVEGDHATLSIRFVRYRQDIHLQREDGLWKIDLSGDLKPVLKLMSEAASALPGAI